MAITDMEMADLVREVCHAGGDGPLVLGGPLPGFRSFAAALNPGASFPYVIQGVADPAQWEAGTGGLDGEGRLLRTPQASSAGGGVVDFVVGEKHVGLALHAGWVAQVNAHGHGLDEITGLEAALAGKQAASGELSAIAALAATGFGRGLLTRADGAAVRSYVGALGGSGEAQISAGTLTVNATGAAFTPIASETITAYRNEGIAIVAARGDGVGASLRAYAYGASSASVRLYRAQGSQASPANLENGAVIGDVASFAYIGGAFEEVTRMRATLVSATPGASNKQVMFSWHATRDGSSGGPASLMRLQYGMVDFAGHVVPLTDNLYALGSASARWSQVYAASGTINTSDARSKCDVGTVEDALIEAWGAVGWQRYRFVEAVADKGDAARWHLGLVAQQVRDVIDARLGQGAAIRWGLLCHDNWAAEPELRSEDGVLVRAARDAGERWGLRYDECFALEALWQRRAIAALAARLDALETGGGDAGG